VAERLGDGLQNRAGGGSRRVAYSYQPSATADCARPHLARCGTQSAPRQVAGPPSCCATLSHSTG